MKNLSRLFIITNGEWGGWTGSTKTSFVVSVKDDRLEVKVKSGRDPYAYEVNTAFGRFLREYETEFGEKVALYERQKWYRFCYRQGSSGCQDTFIETDCGDGFPERKRLMHESCFGKTGGFGCFVYDLLDLCVAASFLVVEDGCYVYHEEDDDKAGLEMQVVRPRLTQYEQGWTSPWERPEGVAYLTVCRQAPKPEQEESSDKGEEDGE